MYSSFRYGTLAETQCARSKK